jgi:hypothetical protein
MTKLNLNMRPTGGYWFIEHDGTKIHGKNWTTLTLAVAKYRTRNGLAPGDPAAEVRAQVCARTPQCTDANPEPAPPVPPVIVTIGKPQRSDPHTIKSRVLQWLTAKRTEKQRHGTIHPKVNPGEAGARAAVCRECSQNKEIASGCGSCQVALREFRGEVLGDNTRNLDKALGGCGIIGSDLQVAVHLDEIRMDNPALPAHCWRKVTTP